MTLELQLTDEEARLLAANLSWQLRQLDAALGRAESRELRQSLVAEIEKMLALRAHFLAPRAAEPELGPELPSPWADVMTDGEGDPVPREDLAGV